MASNQVFVLWYSPPLKVVFSVLNKGGRCNLNINSSSLLILFLIFNRDFYVVCLCLCWLQAYLILSLLVLYSSIYFPQVLSNPYAFKTGLLLCSCLGGELSIISLFASLRALTSSGPIPTWMDRTITRENSRQSSGFIHWCSRMTQTHKRPACGDWRENRRPGCSTRNKLVLTGTVPTRGL